jgi:GH24 family phage-related lysozyme (muramidase)
MHTYFTDFAAAMTSAAASGKSPVVFHMEPDTWGYIQQTFGDDPSVCAFSVASSGYPGLGGLPNDARGFAQAMISIRNALAPNVILAFHVSMWGANWFPTAGTPTPYANHLITFYNNLHASFDMLFFETSDADAAYQVLHPERWSSSTTWFAGRAYWDVNAWRLGYGSDTEGPDQVHVTEGMETTKARALQNLALRVPQFQTEAVYGKTGMGPDTWGKLTENQRTAITSLVYNYGRLPIIVTPSDPEKTATAIRALQNANGGVNRKRRIAEAAFYLTPDVAVVVMVCHPGAYRNNLHFYCAAEDMSVRGRARRSW